MKNYNPELPLISLHIPKCSGTSLLRAFADGHKEQKFNLIRFYPDIGISLPENYSDSKTIIHGHFVRWKNAAVEDKVAKPEQFVTVVRDPIDALISGYWYGIQNGHDWAMKHSPESFLKWHIDANISPIFGALQKLEDETNPENIVSKFLIIKTADQIDLFIEELSEMLKISMPKIGKHNVSDKYSKKISKEIIDLSALIYKNEINLVRYLNGQTYY